MFHLWNENKLMSLFYSYIAGSLHVSGPQAHLQERSYSCSHNHWFSICLLWTRALYWQHIEHATRYWTNGCVNSCTNSPEDGPVGPKHVETKQYTNKIVTSVGFHSIRWKDARYKKLKIYVPPVDITNLRHPDLYHCCCGSPCSMVLAGKWRENAHLHPSGYYMYHQFNIQQFYVLPIQCIYVFCVDLRTKSDYFPIQH